MRTTLLALTSAALLACGPTTPTVSLGDLFPKDNAVAGYAENTALGQPGVEIARGATAIENLVDGDAAPFIDKGVVAFAWERYVAGTYKLDARVWQMKSAANATETFDYLAASATAYTANTWTALSVGEVGRIADTGSSWWLNTRKGVYIVEVKIVGKDTTSRADIETFANAMLSKIP